MVVVVGGRCTHLHQVFDHLMKAHQKCPEGPRVTWSRGENSCDYSVAQRSSYLDQVTPLKPPVPEPIGKSVRHIQILA